MPPICIPEIASKPIFKPNTPGLTLACGGPHIVTRSSPIAVSAGWMRTRGARRISWANRPCTMQSYVRLARMWTVYELRRRRLGDCGRNGMGLANDLLCSPAGTGTRRGGAASRNGLGIVTSRMYNPLADHNGTPPDFFARLHAACDFTVDACATKPAALLPQFFSPEQDGLKQSWVGHRVGPQSAISSRQYREMVGKGTEACAGFVLHLLR